MRNDAYAEICGELKEDIVIKGDEKRLICGLIYVLINENTNDQIEDDNSKPSYIPVLLKGVNIIKKHGNALKKGCRVWLVGKFEVIENAYIAFEDLGLDDVNGIIISVHDRNRLIVLSDVQTEELVPNNDNQIINTLNFNNKVCSWASNFN